MITKNYDLNIWDRLSHESYGEQSGGWEIQAYKLYLNKHGDISSEWDEAELTIKLTADETKALTLGWPKELGGDYAEDEDFFIDVEGFFDIYKNIPQRVADLLNSLPPYEMRVHGQKV